MKAIKGQVAIMDLVLAFVISFGLIIILLSFIDQPTDIINDRIQIEDKLIKALEATNILLNTYGKPINWDNETVLLPSIINKQNVIDLNKLNNFKNLNYERKKELLNLEGFNYTLIVKSNTSEIIDGKINEDTEIVTLNRIALVGGESVYVQFKVW
ncbi:hypothetical protein HY498_01860 [Candidatus Woesearchaeota archaeon]|nr:hypothetical protein [Candidatus Woesearchaeota archaeon]